MIYEPKLVDENHDSDYEDADDSYSNELNKIFAAHLMSKFDLNNGKFISRKFKSETFRFRMENHKMIARCWKQFPDVKRRVKALKKLQLDSAMLDVSYHKAVHSLECEYLKLCSPLHEKRAKIISEDGPEEEYSDVSSSDEEFDECIIRNVLSVPNVEKKCGLPGFWLGVLKSVDFIAEMIEPYDEDILLHLHELNFSMSEADPMSFTLNFVFGQNPFFDNPVLTKQYFITCEVDEEKPMLFDGPEIVHCVGCVIEWKSGKDVTKKVLLAKQKHKFEDRQRTVRTNIPMPSFFDFFKPPTIDDPKEPDLQTMELLAADFEMGYYMKERIIPHAYWFFTGEAVIQEGFDDVEYNDDEDGEEDETGEEGKDGEDDEGEGDQKGDAKGEDEDDEDDDEGEADQKGGGDTKEDGDEEKNEPDEDLAKFLA